MLPPVGRYTREGTVSRTSWADVPKGASQKFISGKDVPAEWWYLYRSPALNALVARSIAANPNLQLTLAALRIANENTYAQQGKYFPLVAANFNPSRHSRPASLRRR